MEVNNLKIAVLSGKGGTGKTLIGTNLAVVAGKATYIDCDVEEPNGFLFLKPKDISKETIEVDIPKVNESLCNGCRKCVDFCKFNALAYVKDKLIIFDEICHSCGGCFLVCPEKALEPVKKPIGKVEVGNSKDIVVKTGILNIGEASGIPIIKNLLEKNKDNNLIIIDCPPGSACIVMESIKDADYCILVGEPTIFGAHNLEMVYDLVRLFNKPLGVVLNKTIKNEYNPSKSFCLENRLRILEEIPFDSELGKINSDGKILVNKSKKYRDIFISLLEKIKKEISSNEGITNS